MIFRVNVVQEARALLGRLEYQRGNYDAALQVFQGIDIRGLSSRMTRAIFERVPQRKPCKKAVNSIPTSVMSMHSVSLLLEAILLKARSLEELARYAGKSLFISTNMNNLLDSYILQSCLMMLFARLLYMTL